MNEWMKLRQPQAWWKGYALFYFFSPLLDILWLNYTLAMATEKNVLYASFAAFELRLTMKQLLNDHWQESRQTCDTFFSCDTYWISGNSAIQSLICKVMYLQTNTIIWYEPNDCHVMVSVTIINVFTDQRSIISIILCRKNCANCLWRTCYPIFWPRLLTYFKFFSCSTWFYVNAKIRYRLVAQLNALTTWHILSLWRERLKFINEIQPTKNK